MTAAPAAVSRWRWWWLVAWAAVFGGSVAAIVFLHHLGGRPGFAVDFGDLWTWLDVSSPERVALGLGRLVALVLAYWVAGTTLLYTLARTARLPALARSIEWATLPPCRRLAERAVAATLAVSSLASGAVPAMADEGTAPDSPLAVVAQEKGYVPVPAGDSARAVTRPSTALPIAMVIDAASPDDDDARDEDHRYLPTPAGTGIDGTVPPLPFLRSDPPADTDPAPNDTPATDPTARFHRKVVQAETPAEPTLDQTWEHTVVPGDNLWLIAEQRLATVLERSPTDAEIAPYWVRVIEANRDSLRSGDPDLIFPGEIVHCPPIQDAG